MPFFKIDGTLLSIFASDLRRRMFSFVNVWQDLSCFYFFVTEFIIIFYMCYGK